MFTLINTDGLVDESSESGGSTDCSEVIFYIRFQSVIKEQALRVVVEVERGDGGLEFNSISCSGFGLTEARQFIFAGGLEIAIKVQIAESFLERRVIVAKGMIRLFGDIASPREGSTAKESDDKKDFVFILDIGVGAHVEREGALSHEVPEFRYLAGEFRRRWNFGVSSCLSWSFFERGG